MSTVSRDWATPLTIGVFTLMAATGALMFFHLDSGLQKSVHEWLGWGLVAAIALHATANFPGFKRHFLAAGRGRPVLAASVVLLAASFVAVPRVADSAPPPVLAMRAVAQAPLATVAALAGKPVEQVKRDLAAAGIVLAGDNDTIAGVAAGDRDRLGRAMVAVFQPGAAPR